MSRTLISLLVLGCSYLGTLNTVAAQPYDIQLTKSQTATLASLIWKNEGAGKKQFLTVWNKNEAFPSMGIGHFIWYPTEDKGPYIEQFPTMIAFLSENGVQIPSWLQNAKTAPWKSREAFYQQFDQAELTELRDLLAKTTSLQAEFITQRLEKGIPAILEASNEEQQVIIKRNLDTLITTPEGIFVLLDYINFKGEGVSAKEQYQGYGWGLKQVLLAMPEKTSNSLLSFALAADEILTRRVKNAPKNELNWLKGWRVRIHKYPNLDIK
ncbi:hypothetical protein [Psychromonas aquatilis]|uniref:Uncharacterized protein n=1 Tax=Psychromonas aquatilis TaxID=2005072 RepID=A0ABU9GR86_9GAMM